MRIRFDRNRQLLIAAVVVVAVAPLLGAVFRGGVPPLEFGPFPPNVAASPKPPFSPLYFAAGALVAGAILVFLLFPALFGFHESGTRKRPAGGRLPWWFWVGAVVNLSSWYAHWFGDLAMAKYSFIPLWWGFIFAVDGIVYRRTGGRSMFATETERFVVIGVVSIPAWGFFEFLNYYADEFWVYPNNQIFSPTGQALWYLASFSVVLPAIFEWYTLLHTFDGLWNRWARGPSLTVSNRVVAWALAFGFVALVLFGRFPFLLFPFFWVGPPLVLTAAVAVLGFWTPFQPIVKGNWSLVVVAGIASFANGIFWELWNYGSKFFHGGQITNPNYWYYDIPYVNRFHPFSEMPILGYFGYLPYGFLAWVCWLIAAHVLGLDPSFDLTPGDGEVEPAAPLLAASHRASAPPAPVISR
jgi:hypothetical protein